MPSLSNISQMNKPKQMFVCPNCDTYGCADYVLDNTCPACKYPLFSNDFIYMPDFKDAYEIARARSYQNKSKKAGFGEDTQ